MIAVLILTLVALNLGFRLGMRYNLRLAASVRAELEQRFQPQEAEWTPAGFGVGWGFELALGGDITSLSGILTTLPRYQILYLPIARLLGRGDLLKLVFHVSDTIPPGVGSIVRESARGSRWHAVERDADWRQETVNEGSDRYRLFAFNPLVFARLRDALPRFGAITGLHQVSIDSRSGTVTAFLRPERDTLTQDLERVESLIFSLTTPPSRGRLQ